MWSSLEGTCYSLMPFGITHSRAQGLVNRAVVSLSQRGFTCQWFLTMICANTDVMYDLGQIYSILTYTSHQIFFYLFFVNWALPPRIVLSIPSLFVQFFCSFHFKSLWVCLKTHKTHKPASDASGLSRKPMDLGRGAVHFETLPGHGHPFEFDGYHGRSWCLDHRRSFHRIRLHLWSFGRRGHRRVTWTRKITWKLTMDSRKRRFLVEIIEVRFPCYFWGLSMSMISGFPTWCNDLSNWLTDQIPVQPNFAWNMQLNDTRCAEQSA